MSLWSAWYHCEDNNSVGKLGNFSSTLFSAIVPSQDVLQENYRKVKQLTQCINTHKTQTRPAVRNRERETSLILKFAGSWKAFIPFVCANDEGAEAREGKKKPEGHGGTAQAL